MWRYILLICLIFAPSVSKAEICIADTGYVDSVVTANGQTAPWGGCGALDADTFEIPVGARVTLGGTITMSGLKVNGGTLVLAPDLVLKLNGPLELNGTAGGRLIAYSHTVMEGRIVSFTVAAANAGQTIVVDQDAAASGVVAGNELQFLDEDGNDLTSPISKKIMIGPGNPTPDVYRPSFNKWRINNITNAVTNTITYEIDELTGGSLTGTTSYDAGAYVGTRFPVVATGSPITPSVVTYAPMHTSTIYTVGATDVDSDADLGSWYVQWTSGVCTGLVAKIIHTEDTGAKIHVAGDANKAGCGLSPFIITQGQRAGDKVRVMRMPTIDFNYDAEGSVRWDISRVKLEADGLKLIRMSDQSGTTIGGLDNNRFNFVAYDSRPDCSIGINYASESYFTNAELGYNRGAYASGNDTAVFGVYSQGPSGNTHIGGCKADMQGFKWANLYIHDQQNDPGGAQGSHGIFHRVAQNIKITKTRSERHFDDLIGGLIRPLHTDNSNMSFYHIIAEEQKPDQYASDQCIDVQAYVATGDEGFDALLNTNATLHEILAMGCGSNTLGSSVAASSISNAVFGGASNAVQTGEGAQTFGVIGSGADPLLIDNYPNVMDNILMFPEASSGESGNNDATLQVAGSVSNSYFASPNSLPGFRLYAVSKVSNTFVDSNGTGLSYIFGGTGTNVTTSILEYDNSAMLCSNCGQLGILQFAQGGQSRNAPALTINNSLFAFGTMAWKGFTTDAFNNSWQTGLVNIDGLALTQIATAGGSIGNLNNTTNNGANVNRTCVRTTVPLTGADDRVATGANQTINDDVYHVSSLSPIADKVFSKPSMLVSRNQTGPCSGFYPSDIGLSVRSYSMSMLGDLVNNDWETFSSRPDPTGTTSAGGGSVSW